MVGISRDTRLKDVNLVSLRGAKNVNEGLTFRNLIIPRIVEAIRNIDTKTGRSDYLQV